mgnify:CR=1 FL=1
MADRIYVRKPRKGDLSQSEQWDVHRQKMLAALPSDLERQHRRAFLNRKIKEHNAYKKKNNGKKKKRSRKQRRNRSVSVTLD